MRRLPSHPTRPTIIISIKQLLLIPPRTSAHILGTSTALDVTQTFFEKPGAALIPLCKVIRSSRTRGSITRKEKNKIQVVLGREANSIRLFRLSLCVPPLPGSTPPPQPLPDDFSIRFNW